ncbi:BRO family protein [Acetobacteraceae bacterium ESL0709]|nr:BRO family protein [Acetobacteraceae bacterium ESL0697]MDF7677391.1 BRO family protein [Acetobacteraceae bacterium ESL0709]
MPNAKRTSSTAKASVQDHYVGLMPPAPPEDPRIQEETAKRIENAYKTVTQKRLNDAIQLVLEAASGKGTLIPYFCELSRRFGHSTAPSSEIQSSSMLPFSFEGKEVRIFELDNTPWWVAADVCSILEIVNPTRAIERLDDDDYTLHTMKGVDGKPRETNIINESGLWSLVLTSRKPEAKRFKKWLTSEVIPAIRKTGGYNLSRLASSPQSEGGESSPRNHKAKRRPDVLFRLLKQIALDSGKSEQEAISLAGQGVRHETGLDVMGLIGMN